MTSPRIHRILRQHVLTDRLMGVTALPRNPLAVVEQLAEPPREAVAPADLPSRQMSSRSTAAVIPPASQQPLAAAPAMPRSPSGSSQLPPLRPLAPPPAAIGSPELRLRFLQTLDESQVRGCQKCDLCLQRTQTVFGEGNPQADLMFIGEGPGEQEDKTGRPFVGPAGQLLDKMITAMGLSREEVYIANAVKCRPPQNRPPTPQETQTCSGYLHQQINIIRPRVIVTLGGPATKLMLDTALGITALRGRWHESQSPDTALGDPTQSTLPGLTIPVMPTFHPSYILRAYTPDNRKKVWSDLQQVMTYLQQV